MSLCYEDEQNAYHLTYNTVRLFGNHQQAYRWACYARDYSWKNANQENDDKMMMKILEENLKINNSYNLIKFKFEK